MTSQRRAWIITLSVVGTLMLSPLVVVLLLRDGRSVDNPENRSEAKTDDEELVKRYVLACSTEPEKVKFLRWGPHMNRKETRALMEEAGLFEEPLKSNHSYDESRQVESFVRVRYQFEKQVLDCVFVISAGKTVRHLFI